MAALPPGLTVRLLQEDLVLSAVLVMGVALEALVALAASGAPTEEATEEAVEGATGER